MVNIFRTLPGLAPQLRQHSHALRGNLSQQFLLLGERDKSQQDILNSRDKFMILIDTLMTFKVRVFNGTICI